MSIFQSLFHTCVVSKSEWILCRFGLGGGPRFILQIDCALPLVEPRDFLYATRNHLSYLTSINHAHFLSKNAAGKKSKLSRAHAEVVGEGQIDFGFQTGW